MNKTVEVSQGARDAIEQLTRPIIGIENRTPQEAFDIMADRFRSFARTTPSTDAVREAVGRERTWNGSWATPLTVGRHQRSDDSYFSVWTDDDEIWLWQNESYCRNGDIEPSGVIMGPYACAADAARAAWPDLSALQLADTRTTQPDSALREAAFRAGFREAHRVTCESMSQPHVLGLENEAWAEYSATLSPAEPSPLTREVLDATRTEAAARIVDIWMGGNTDWRARLHDSDFLESADWLRAYEEAGAALSAIRALASPEQREARLSDKLEEL